MKAPDAAARPRVFYGWVVVWAAFVGLGTIFGTAYSFAAFFRSFAEKFSAQRADVSLVFGLCGLLYFVLGVPGGALSDRFGPRITTTAGMVIITAALLGASFATSLLAVYLAFGVGLGIGIALIYTPTMGAVQPWFVRHRGLASGISSAGIGAGTLVLPLLVSTWIEAWGWREGMRILAAVVAVLGIAATLCLEKNPAGRGLGPDGGPPLAGAGSGHSALAGMALRDAVRSPGFRWLYVSLVLAAPVMFVPFAHVSAHARDLSVPEGLAVGLVGLIGIGSLVGRFAIGWLADRIGRLRTLVLMTALMGACYLFWYLAPGYALLAVFAVCFGLCYGGIVSLLPPICMDLFGGRSLSAVIGVLYSGAALGNLLGPVAAGAVFDRTGSYVAVMGACVLCAAAATWAAWRVSRLHPGAEG
ncbi:MAG TPA: MCT family MFS transporter [Quisquiliibacterium sp.]|nr:MCT family MFS transporter [Quisquiliibacterium sp.]